MSYASKIVDINRFPSTAFTLGRTTFYCFPALTVVNFRPTFYVSTAVRGRLTVAVRTKQPQIFEPIIVIDTVDVIETLHNGLAQPFRQAANVAMVD